MSTPNKKVVITKFGGPDVLSIVTEPIAAPANGEIQCQIIYAGFTGADTNMRKGIYPMQKPAPLTPGYCFVGRVRSKGPGCASTLAEGTLVTALTVYDSDAEYINVPEKYLYEVPAAVDMKTACALTLDWNTAYGMVFRTAKVHQGQRVFIHGLSGAVGYALTSLCLLQGATVYGTASERNHDALRNLGVTPYVYSNKDWMTSMNALGGAHIVFDPLGFESWDESYAILSSKEKSLLVGYGGNKASLSDDPNEKRKSNFPNMIKLLAKNANVFSRKGTYFYYITRDDKTFGPELKALFKLVAEGKVEVPIKTVWEFDDVVKAHESWGKGSGMGSMLLRVAAE